MLCYNVRDGICCDIVCIIVHCPVHWVSHCCCEVLCWPRLAVCMIASIVCSACLEVWKLFSDSLKDDFFICSFDLQYAVYRYAYNL